MPANVMNLVSLDEVFLHGLGPGRRDGQPLECPEFGAHRPQ